MNHVSVLALNSTRQISVNNETKLLNCHNLYLRYGHKYWQQNKRRSLLPLQPLITQIRIVYHFPACPAELPYCVVFPVPCSFHLLCSFSVRTMTGRGSVWWRLFIPCEEGHVKKSHHVGTYGRYSRTMQGSRQVGPISDNGMCHL
jgi:hypothetical protein